MFLSSGIRNASSLYLLCNAIVIATLKRRCFIISWSELDVLESLRLNYLTIALSYY